MFVERLHDLVLFTVRHTWIQGQRETAVHDRLRMWHGAALGPNRWQAVERIGKKTSLDTAIAKPPHERVACCPWGGRRQSHPHRLVVRLGAVGHAL